MREEEWLPVVGYEGLYEVSNNGHVRSKKTGPRKQFLDDRGYYHIRLYDKDKRPCYSRRPVSQIVLEAFVGPRPEGMLALHGPSGSLDNTVENLYWGTAQQNADDRKRDGTQWLGFKCEHPKTPENTYVATTSVGETCYTCMRNRTRRQRGYSDMSYEQAVSSRKKPWVE